MTQNCTTLVWSRRLGTRHNPSQHKHVYKHVYYVCECIYVSIYIHIYTHTYTPICQYMRDQISTSPWFSSCSMHSMNHTHHVCIIYTGNVPRTPETLFGLPVSKSKHQSHTHKSQVHHVSCILRRYKTYLRDILCF